MIYVALGIITYVSLICVLYVVSDGISYFAGKCGSAVARCFRLIAGKPGEIFYIDDKNERHYI